MIDEKFKDLVEEIKNKFEKEKNILSIIVFGSVAKREADIRSDLDLFIITDNLKTKEKAWTVLLDLGKKYDRRIQVVFTDSKLSGLERNFIETVLREGVTVKGSLPDVSIKKLELDPYAMLSYDLSSMTDSKKKRISRMLYGKRTEKKYKGKTYVYEKKGLIRELKGWRTGIASIMLPEKSCWKIEKMLREEGAKVKKLPIWMAKP